MKMEREIPVFGWRCFLFCALELEYVCRLSAGLSGRKLQANERIKFYQSQQVKRLMIPSFTYYSSLVTLSTKMRMLYEVVANAAAHFTSFNPIKKAKLHQHQPHMEPPIAP